MTLRANCLFALTLFVAGTFACSNPSTSSSGAGGSGGTGACSQSDGCGSDEYCDFPDDKCGTGEPGTCVKRSGGCSDGAVIICGCNGVVAYGGCQTAQGFDTNIDASSCDLSTPPNDSFGLHNQAIFLCGDEFCHTGVSYCRRAISDIGGKPDHYDCQLLPSSCDGGPSTPADCACLAKEGCGDMCTVAAAEELTLTCPGG